MHYTGTVYLVVKLRLNMENLGIGGKVSRATYR